MIPPKIGCRRERGWGGEKGGGRKITRCKDSIRDCSIQILLLTFLIEQLFIKLGEK